MSETVRQVGLTKEQLEERKKGIGGSEISAIVGLNPWMTPLDVWRAKCDSTYFVEVTPPMERGNFLEDGIAQWYAHRKGVLRLVNPGSLVHRSIPVVRCTPDRIATLADGSLVDLSIKSPGPFSQDEWGEFETDEIPEAYFLQVQWELIVLEELSDIRHAHVAAPIGNDLGTYNVLASAEVQGRLIAAAQKFWRDHVETGKPPALDGTESASNYLKARYPHNTQPLAKGTPEATELMRYLRLIREQKEAARLEEEMVVNKLKDLCAFHEGMTGPNWRISWKNTKATTKTDWEAIAKELGAKADLIEKHTRVAEGARRFLPTWSDKK